MLLKRKLKKGIVKNVELVKKSFFKGKIFQTNFSCSLKKKYNEEAVMQASERLAERKQKKKKVINILMLVLNLCIVVGLLLYYALTSGIKSFKELIFENVAYQYLFAAIGVFLAALIVDTIKYYQLIKKTSGKKSIKTALNTHMIGRYYDCITPFAVGGQPFQIYYLHKNGLSGSKATSIPLAKQFFSMIAFTFISIGVLISHFVKPITGSPIILILAVVSIIINIITVAVILLFSVSKRVGPAFVIKILKLLNKMHIIKNYKVKFFQVARFVKSYQRSIKDFSKSAWTIFSQLFFAFFTYFATYSIAYFIYLAFLPLNPTPVLVSWADVFCCAVLCDLVSGIIPLPGGTGMAEISFDNLFKRLFSITVFPWALMIWRTLTYFVFIIVGGIAMSFSFIKSSRKLKKKSK